MDGCDGEKLHVNHFWNLKGEPYISDEGSWFVYQCDLHYSKKQTNIIFIFHIFKIITLLLASLQLKHHLPMMAFICPVSLKENIVTLEDRNY